MFKIGDYLINKNIAYNNIYEVIKPSCEQGYYVAFIGSVIDNKFKLETLKSYVYHTDGDCYSVVDNDLRNHINKLLTFQ